MRKLIAIAAAALFALPAFAAPVLAPGQTGAVGANVACTNLDGAAIRCIQPSVTLNDATGAAIGTSGNPLVTSPATGATSTVKIDQTTPGATNGVVVNSGSVGGLETTGSAATGGGLRVMGKDGSGFARDIVTDGSGDIISLTSGLSPGGSVVNFLASKLDSTSTPTAASTWGLTVMGFDGANSRPMRQDTNGTALVGRVSPGTAVTGASGNVANANAVATLAGVASKTTYITGFRCQAAGSTAAVVVNLTVAGVVTGTMTYTFVFPAGATTAATAVGQDFSNPVPASAANTAIVVTLPAGGAGNTNASCAAQGFQL